MQIIQSLQTNNLGVTSVTQVFDQYDCEILIKQLEGERRTGRETPPMYVISGRRRVPNYRTFMKNATKKSALAEFICAYLTDTAPQFLKEHQWLMLAGGFTNGQLAKVVEHTGVRERPELFSTHEEADIRILLHTIDLATTHSRIIVRCEDTDVSVLLIYHCRKGMFANCKVYTNAWSLQQNNESPEVHSCQRNNIDNWARCFDLLTSVTWYQRLRYNVTTLQNRQANCLQRARGQHRRHAVFGRARSV